MNNEYDNIIPDARCRGGICLEPRLQEYIKKKMYYKGNNIEPVVPAEKEFCISREDVKKIKAFMRGDRNLYQSSNQSQYHASEDEYEPQPTVFLSTKLCNDRRFNKLKEKVQKNQEAIKMKDNLSEISMYAQPRIGQYDEYATNKDNSEHSRQMRSLDVFEEPQSVNSRDFEVGNRYSLTYKREHDPRVYNNVPVKPQLQYKSRLYYQDEETNMISNLDHNHNTEEIIGNMDRYGEYVERGYQNASDMDLENKVVIPNVACNNKRAYNTNRYNAVPYMGRRIGKQERSDITSQTGIDMGLPTRGAKSYGYENPFEHYFDYIRPEMQKPEHTVMERGFPSRQLNKVNGRKNAGMIYERDIY